MYTSPQPFPAITPSVKTSSRFLSLLLAAFTLMMPLQGLAATIGGVVWADSNRNGIRDAGEAPVPNLELKLYWDKNRDGYPERLDKRARTDGNGRYSFNVAGPMAYTVGIEVESMPENMYRVTMRDKGGDESHDNDVDRNTLRTMPIRVIHDNENHFHEADVGLMVYGGLRYEGTELVPSHNNATYNAWLYNDYKFWTPTEHNIPFSVMEKWAKMYVEMGLMQQQLHLAPLFMSYGTHSDYFQDEGLHWQGRNFPEESPDIGLRILALAWQTNASGSYSGGGNNLVDIALRDPNDILAHWGLLYEMNRANAGDWMGKSTWHPSTFIIAHLTTEMFLYKKGGMNLLNRNVPLNRLNYGYGVETTQGWKKSNYDYLSTFGNLTQDVHVDLNLSINNQIQTRPMWSGSLMLGFLNELYRTEGIEPVVEILQNMVRKNRNTRRTALEAMLAFQSSVNEATDDRYARTLVDVWGLPNPAQHQRNYLSRGPYGFGDGEAIKIQGSNGLYVKQSLSKELFCDASEADAAIFTVVLNANGSMSLRAFDGNFLSPHDGNTDTMTSFGKNPFDITRFWLEDVGNGEFAIRSYLHDTLVCSENGSKPMSCNRTHVGSYERFRLLKTVAPTGSIGSAPPLPSTGTIGSGPVAPSTGTIGSGPVAPPSVEEGTYALLGNNGRYVRVASNGKMRCDVTAAQATTLTLKNAGSGSYALQAPNGLYVSSEFGGTSMTANRGGLGSWERFSIVQQGDRVAFLATASKTYVSSENGGYDMTCNRGAIGSWERFKMVKVDVTATVNGRLKQVDALNYDRAVGVNSYEQIWATTNGGQNWSQIGGRLKYVSIGQDGSFWGVNSGDSIYRRHPSGGGWSRVSGALVQIDALDYNRAVGVNKYDQVYYTSNGGRSWTPISGSLSHVSIGTDGSMWGVNRNGIIYRRSPTGGWQTMPGGLSQIDALDYHHATGTNAGGSTYFFSGGWRSTGSGFKHVSVGTDSSTWYIGTDDKIYRSGGAGKSAGRSAVIASKEPKAPEALPAPTTNLTASVESKDLVEETVLPAPVTLVDTFEARQTDEGVQLVWSTVQEENTIGFHVLVETGEGLERISDKLIVAGDKDGHYRALDQSAVGGRYHIEAVSIDLETEPIADIAIPVADASPMHDLPVITTIKQTVEAHEAANVLIESGPQTIVLDVTDPMRPIQLNGETLTLEGSKAHYFYLPAERKASVFSTEAE